MGLAKIFFDIGKTAHSFGKAAGAAEIHIVLCADNSESHFRELA